MPKIEITWLSDSTDCDQAGCGGGYSEGFIATLDGSLLAEFIPKASCYGGDSCDENDAYKIIFKALGFELETSYE